MESFGGRLVAFGSLLLSFGGQNRKSYEVFKIMGSTPYFGIFQKFSLISFGGVW